MEKGRRGRYEGKLNARTEKSGTKLGEEGDKKGMGLAKNKE
jgi:hypothetical protein